MKCFIFSILFIGISSSIRNVPSIRKESIKSPDDKASLSHAFQEQTISWNGRNMLSNLDPIPKQLGLSDFRVIERARSASLTRFKRVKRGDSNHVHRGILVMKFNNREALENKLYDVSVPTSSNYGKFLNREELDQLAGVNPQSVDHVLRYFQIFYSEEVTVVSKSLHNEFITIDAPIKVWESILSTKFYEFSFSDPDIGKDDLKGLESARVVRAEEYSLPAELINHVSFVFNTVSFPEHHDILKVNKVKTLSANSDEHTLAHGEISGAVTPALLNRIYAINSNIGSSQASQAVYETIGQTFSPSDLTYFQTYFGLTQEAVATVIGDHSNNNACKTNNGNDCAEANLDIQYLMAVAQKVPTTYYYWTGEDFMVDWILAVANMQNPPLVFSISYGIDEDALTSSYAETFDTYAMILGVQGVTITVSSGDDGAISSFARRNPLKCGYSPSFPASSPYVTAVGGTMGPENGNTEVACQADKDGIITSGGGFSTLYSAPVWQASITSAYLTKLHSTGKDPSPGYPATGRGYPDVSLVAYNYAVALSSKITGISGTSASSPAFAGMVSLVNAARLSRRKSPLGWINPAIYSLSSHFTNDILTGDNHCVASASVCCSQGYSATQGWDAVTGFGSVNFTAFKNTMLNLEQFSPTASPSPGPGEPMLSPTRSPSLSPTFIATNSPTTAPGWIRITQYSAENCAGDVTTLSGIPTDSCMIEYDTDKNPVGSMRYSCTSGSAAVSVYSDTKCSTSALLGEIEYGLGCAYKVEDYYYAPSFYSVQVDCVVGVDKSNIFSVAKAGNKYALEMSFDSTSGCDESKQSEIMAIKESFCFPLQEEYSYKVSYPTVNYYSGTSCKGKPVQSQTLSSTCEEVSSYYYYDDYYVYEYYGPTGSVALFSVWSEYTVAASAVASGAPSLRPSLAPTMKPTVKPTIRPTFSLAPSKMPSKTPSAPPTLTGYTPPPSTLSPSPQPTSLRPTTFSPSRKPTISITAFPTPAISQSVTIQVQFSQELSGISESDWNSCGQCFSILQDSLDSIIPALDPTNIIFVSAEPSPRNYLGKMTRSKALRDNAVRAVAAVEGVAEGESIVVKYFISAAPSSLGVVSADEAIAIVTAGITTAAAEGYLDNDIQHNAIRLQIAPLLGVVTQSMSVTSSSVVAETQTESDSESVAARNKSVLLATFMALVVTLLVFSVVLCGMRYSMKGRGDDPSHYAMVNGDSLHGSALSDADTETADSERGSPAVVSNPLRRQFHRPAGMQAIPDSDPDELSAIELSNIHEESPQRQRQTQQQRQTQRQAPVALAHDQINDDNHYENASSSRDVASPAMVGTIDMDADDDNL